MTKLLTPVEVIQALQDGKQVEVKFSAEHGWEDVLVRHMNLEELINPEHQFRLPPQVIRIGDIKFPKPETEKLSIGTTYYITDLQYDKYVQYFLWQGNAIDYRNLSLGIIHLSRENAIAHAKALIKLSGGNYE